MDDFIAHILVVDDDNGIRSLVKQYLNENNYLVTTANNAGAKFTFGNKKGTKFLWNSVFRQLTLDNTDFQSVDGCGPVGLSGLGTSC